MSDAILTEVLTMAVLARVPKAAAGKKGFAFVCQSGSLEDEHHFLFDCPAYSHMRSDYSKLFQHPAPTVASFLATEQQSVLGSFLKACFATDFVY